jgi:hypothetical protein
MTTKLYEVLKDGKCITCHETIERACWAYQDTPGSEVVEVDLESPTYRRLVSPLECQEQLRRSPKPSHGALPSPTASR